MAGALGSVGFDTEGVVVNVRGETASGARVGESGAGGAAEKNKQENNNIKIG